MSPPWVDSSSAPRTARKRCTGTATETMTSPRSLMRTMLGLQPVQRLRDFRIALAVVGAELAIERQVAVGRASARIAIQRALEAARLLARPAAAGRSAARRRGRRDCGCRG